jgi:hypothetical protein
VVDIILASRRNQVRSPDVFRGLGLDPLTTKLLVVKSTNHFRAEFEKIAAAILYIAPPAASPATVPRIRPEVALDPDAFADLGWRATPSGANRKAAVARPPGARVPDS